MKGIRIVHGKYVQARFIHAGRLYNEMFGPDCSLARELAQIWLAERRKEALMGKLGVKPEFPTKTFQEASAIWLKVWATEINPDGTLCHNERSIRETGGTVEALNRYFGKSLMHLIRPIDVEKWRAARLKTGVTGTTINRQQVMLSSMFNGLERWMKNEKIPAFRLPLDPQSGNVFNPCQTVEKAPNVKRKRVLSLTELRSLKQACLEAKDNDLWEICEMALKSLLRKKDLFALETGALDTIQAKTGRAIQLPIQVLRPLQYANFRKRWQDVRKAARLVDCQFRDLRRSGATLLKSKNWSNKIISEVLGHASTRTTELYLNPDVEHLKGPIKDLEDIIKGL